MADGMVDEVAEARRGRIERQEEDEEDKVWQCGNCEGMTWYLNEDHTIECATCGALPDMGWSWIDCDGGA